MKKLSFMTKHDIGDEITVVDYGRKEIITNVIKSLAYGKVVVENGQVVEYVMYTILDNEGKDISINAASENIYKEPEEAKKAFEKYESLLN